MRNTYPATQSGYDQRVSESADSLRYYLDRREVGYEEFKNAWMKDYRQWDVPNYVIHIIGQTHEYGISTAGDALARKRSVSLVASIRDMFQFTPDIIVHCNYMAVPQVFGCGGRFNSHPI